MAGGSQPKSSFDKPSSSSASASHRKSRWESSAAPTANKPSADSKSNDPKPSKLASNSKPSPKPNTGPSPKPTSATLTDSLPALPGPPFPLPDLGPPPPPTYGFHMLDRRTIVLADGSVRSYFALPPDYQDFPPRPTLLLRFLPMGPTPDFPGAVGGPRFPPMSPEGLGFRDNNQSQNPFKRKYGGGDEEVRYGNNPNGIFPAGQDHRGELLSGTSSPFRRNLGDDSRAGKYMRIAGDSVGVINKYLQVDQNKLNKVFLHFAKMINETEAERKRYLEDGKQGRLHCLACGRFATFKLYL